MNDTQVREGMKAKAVFVGTTEQGHVYTGRVYDPQTQIPWATTYWMEIDLGQSTTGSRLYSGIRFPASLLEMS